MLDSKKIHNKYYFSLNFEDSKTTNQIKAKAKFEDSALIIKFQNYHRKYNRRYYSLIAENFKSFKKSKSKEIILNYVFLGTVELTSNGIMIQITNPIGNIPFSIFLSEISKKSLILRRLDNIELESLIKLINLKKKNGFEKFNDSISLFLNIMKYLLEKDHLQTNFYVQQSLRKSKEYFVECAKNLKKQEKIKEAMKFDIMIEEKLTNSIKKDDFMIVPNKSFENFSTLNNIENKTYLREKNEFPKNLKNIKNETTQINNSNFDSNIIKKEALILIKSTIFIVCKFFELSNDFSRIIQQFENIDKSIEKYQIDYFQLKFEDRNQINQMVANNTLEVEEATAENYERVQFETNEVVNIKCKGIPANSYDTPKFLEEITNNKASEQINEDSQKNNNNEFSLKKINEFFEKYHSFYSPTNYSYITINCVEICNRRFFEYTLDHFFPDILNIEKDSFAFMKMDEIFNFFSFLKQMRKINNKIA